MKNCIYHRLDTQAINAPLKRGNSKDTHQPDTSMMVVQVQDADVFIQHNVKLAGAGRETYLTEYIISEMWIEIQKIDHSKVRSLMKHGWVVIDVYISRKHWRQDTWFGAEDSDMHHKPTSYVFTADETLTMIFYGAYASDLSSHLEQHGFPSWGDATGAMPFTVHFVMLHTDNIITSNNNTD